jgi:selenocysteine lyase/cysteine desulfurase
LDWVLKTGTETIAAQNRTMSEEIIAGALENGWAVRSPLDAGERGGSVMLGLPQGIDPAAAISTLRAKSLYCDARGSTLRLSPGPVTDDASIDLLLVALQELIGWRERRAS